MVRTSNWLEGLYLIIMKNGAAHRLRGVPTMHITGRIGVFTINFTGSPGGESIRNISTSMRPYTHDKRLSI
jgi:hypothetical protein